MGGGLTSEMMRVSYLKEYFKLFGMKYDADKFLQIEIQFKDFDF
jgi:hypothetical protein